MIAKLTNSLALTPPPLPFHILLPQVAYSIKGRGGDYTLLLCSGTGERLMSNKTNVIVYKKIH